MTVSELIKHLELLDPNQRILVQGYEGGLSDITKERIDEATVILNYHHPDDWYYGRHEEGTKEDLEFQVNWMENKTVEFINAYIIRR